MQEYVAGSMGGENTWDVLKVQLTGWVKGSRTSSRVSVQQRKNKQHIRMAWRISVMHEVRQAKCREVHMTWFQYQDVNHYSVENLSKVHTWWLCAWLWTWKESSTVEYLGWEKGVSGEDWKNSHKEGSTTKSNICNMTHHVQDESDAWKSVWKATLQTPTW